MSVLARTLKVNSAKLARSNLSTWRPTLLSQSRLIVLNSGQRSATRGLRTPHGVGNKTVFSRSYTTQPQMTTAPPELKHTLTPALLAEVRTFWFDHVSDENSLILPNGPEMKRWFSRDAEFDKTCVAQFQPALEAIISSDATAEQILAAVNTSDPLNWLSLVLLLDQVPRNCYRGDESRLVFERFDPLASAIALRALDLGIPSQSPIRYKLSYRFWFHLPLMHSESLSVHQRAVNIHEETAQDVEDFLRSERDSLEGYEKKCFDVLAERQDGMKTWLAQTLDFEKRHLVIIERFGRYPHRNGAMGRESTREEVEYLENGGETFG
ncbi:hypothetical protein N7540_010168 [Penicillium herquei]|nr:hypothetical protein N7540_010168 [Penicillium herquei]